MNQILSTNLKAKKFMQKNIFFKLQFAFSILIMIVLIIIFIFYFLSAKQKEQLSSEIVDNYNIYKLYSNNNNYELSNESSRINNIFGIIEIPKINIYYPIFSNLDEELLKISPCKFYGNTLTQNDNICIAGHNYNNSMFFSNLSDLEYNDEIYVYDNIGNKYIYLVSKIYEVKPDDLSPIFNYDKRYKNLTLITCNNLNSNRIIVKAKQEST